MVRAGAKAKLIERYTHLSHRRISEIYRALCGTAPPAGPMMQGKAEYFAVRTPHTSEAWAIQCGIFLECYERLERISQIPMHRGWRLLATFKSYLSITEKLSKETAIKRLDINQAYALLAHCAFLTRTSEAEVKRQRCPTCLLKYPVVVSRSLDSQACPACAMSAHKQRLADHGVRESDEFQVRQGK